MVGGAGDQVLREKEEGVTGYGVWVLPGDPSHGQATKEKSSPGLDLPVTLFRLTQWVSLLCLEAPEKTLKRPSESHVKFCDCF